MTDLSVADYADELVTAPKSKLAPTTGAEIHIQQLNKYYGSVTVLENLNLDIQAGEFLAIVGRSGCGKSTLLRLVAGLRTDQSGQNQFYCTCTDGGDSAR